MMCDVCFIFCVFGVRVCGLAVIWTFGAAHHAIPHTLYDHLLYLGCADLLLHVLLSVKSIFAVLLVLNACAIVSNQVLRILDSQDSLTVRSTDITPHLLMFGPLRRLVHDLHTVVHTLVYSKSL